MVRIGGFLKTQNRIRRQRARGRYSSPYQVGGAIFGKSTMARYPLMYTASRLPRMPPKWIRDRAMKGGTIFGKSTRMRNNPLGFPSSTSKYDEPRWVLARARGAIKRRRR